MSSRSRSLPVLRRAQLPAPVTGPALRWARDFGILGGLHMSILVSLDSHPPTEPTGLTFVACSALLAALLGGVLPALLERTRGVVPFRWLWPGALLLSAGWGVLTLVLGFALTGGLPLLTLSELLLPGAAVGVLQLGWFWFAYTVLTVLKKPTWPLFLLSLPGSALAYLILIKLL